MEDSGRTGQSETVSGVCRGYGRDSSPSPSAQLCLPVVNFKMAVLILSFRLLSSCGQAGPAVVAEPCAQKSSSTVPVLNLTLHLLQKLSLGLVLPPLWSTQLVMLSSAEELPRCKVPRSHGAV